MSSHPSALTLAAAALLLSACAGTGPGDVGWKRSPFAAQTPYPDGAPHTDAQGRARTAFDPDVSFFPIGLYHGLTGTFGGVSYSFETAADAGHNTVVAWGALETPTVLAAAERAGVQVIMSLPTDATVRAARDHDHVLGFDIDHEPSIAETESESLERRDRFLKRRDQIRSIDPDRAVFTVDYPAVREDRLDLWRLWKRTGDVASFWAYPIASDRAPSVGGPVGVGETVRWAANATSGRKPLWFVAQAFESPLRSFDWRMPEPRHARAMAYDALVHGATGLIWFSFDSFVTRAGEVIGISPDPQETFSLTHPHIKNGKNLMRAREGQVERSRVLWNAVARLNRELSEQREIWLSPTAREEYTVEIRNPRTSATPVRTQLKRTRAGLFLVGVNVDDSPVDVRIVPAFAVADVELRAGDAELSLADGRIIGTLAGFGTFVLKLEGTNS